MLDGIDEAGGRLSAVLKLVRHTLLPLGFRVVCTARPESFADPDDLERRFRVFGLCGLDPEVARRLCLKQMQSSVAAASAELLEPAVEEKDEDGSAAAAAAAAATARVLPSHLTALSAIRSEHDRRYREAVPSEVRHACEGFVKPDLFSAKAPGVGTRRLPPLGRDGGKNADSTIALGRGR